MNLRLTILALVFGLSMAGCATEFPGDPADTTSMEYPVGISLHPNGKYLYVLNANFDLKYRANDGGTLMVIDVETGSILDKKTLRTASFGSMMVLNHDASRGYMTVRGSSSLTWFALNEEGDTPSCPLSAGGTTLNACEFPVPEEPTSLAYTRSERQFPLLDADGRPILDDLGNPRVIEQDFDLVVVTHLREGRVSAITVGDTQANEEPSFSMTTAVLLDGPSDVALHRGERFFVAGRVASEVLAFRPAITTDARVIGLFTDSSMVVPTPFSSHEGRSLLFSADGNRLYLSNQSPNSLVIFDTSEGDNDNVSGRQDRIIGMLDLPRGPNEMAWVDRVDGSPLLYVTSFNENVVSIVDVEIPAVVGEIVLGDGPFDIAVDQSRNRAYVSNFAEHTISVLDISDPYQPVEVEIIGGDNAN